MFVKEKKDWEGADWRLDGRQKSMPPAMTSTIFFSGRRFGGKPQTPRRHRIHGEWRENVYAVAV